MNAPALLTPQCTFIVFILLCFICAHFRAIICFYLMISDWGALYSFRSALDGNKVRAIMRAALPRSNLLYLNPLGLKVTFVYHFL